MDFTIICTLGDSRWEAEADNVDGAFAAARQGFEDMMEAHPMYGVARRIVTRVLLDGQQVYETTGRPQ
jgi:hypothetical protein